MADYMNWDDLTDDAEDKGDIASYPLDTLLQIYGTHTVSVEISAAIRKSLQRRGYDMQPACIAHLKTDDRVRIYLAANSCIQKLIEAVQTVTPDNDEILLRFIQENRRTLKIQELLNLAKEIAKES